jgi:hypothetical protein
MPLSDSATWTTYLDLEETKSWLQFPDDASNAQDANLQRIIDMACEWVQNEINRPVAPTRFTERHDGWSGEYIMLHQCPVVEFVSCTEWQSSGGPITLGESTPENPVEGIQIDYLTGRVMRSFAGYSWPRPFFPGSRNIEITYLAGYNPVPPVLWMATAELVAHWWRNTQQASRQVLRVTDYDPTGTQDSLWAGVPYRIQGLVAPYRRTVIG